MEFAEIIRDFAHSQRVPVAAIRAATSQPDEFVEGAVALLQRVRSGRSTRDEDEAVAVLVHVLGEIGDERALPSLLDLLSLPPERMDRLLGGCITESLPQVLMRFGANGAEGLRRLMENMEADDFVRNAAFDAWTYLVLSGHVTRDEAHAYLADYPWRVAPPPGDYGWVSWVDAVAALGFDDLREAVAKVFADEMIPPDVFGLRVMKFDNFERLLAKTLTDPEGWRGDGQFQPFADTVAELSTWYCYSDQFLRDREKAREPRLAAGFGSAVNKYRGVGRNDPCPCGSSKKFKKCCLPGLN